VTRVARVTGGGCPAPEVIPDPAGGGPDTPPALLIQCVGDPLRGDDGAGPAVAAVLQTMFLPDWVRVRDHWGEGTELMQEWAGASRVVVVDAACAGAPVGTVHRLDAHRERMPTDLCYHSSHRFGVAEAIETARALGRLPDQLQLIAIEGAGFGLGQALHPAVRAAVSEVVAELRGLARLPEP
jgi:hydrogenase maturation protease